MSVVTPAREITNAPDQQFVFYGLSWEQYEPVVTSADLTRFLAMRDTLDDTQLELSFEQLVREQLAEGR
jgi:hypothetical protein